MTVTKMSVVKNDEQLNNLCTVSCELNKIRASTFYLLTNKHLILQTVFLQFSPKLKKEAFLHKVTARSSVSAINCNRWKHSKLHQTIIKAHCTNSNFFFLIFPTAKAIFSYSSPFLSSLLSCPLEGPPLVSLTASVSNGKSILNGHREHRILLVSVLLSHPSCFMAISIN